jgi:hypothetical protein
LSITPDARPAPEHRDDPRSGGFQAVGLRIEPHYMHASIHRSPHGQRNQTGYREAIDSRLIDVGKHGLGVETLGPLPLAEIVDVQGEIHSLDYCVEFRASARVVHCLALENGMFRSGLRFIYVEGRELLCGHEHGFSVEASLD